MLHKTQSHSSHNLIFADVLKNSYNHRIYLKNLKYHFLRNTRPKVKSEDHENISVLSIWKKTGHWKGYFITFLISKK
jgi:hypothetical protein